MLKKEENAVVLSQLNMVVEAVCKNDDISELAKNIFSKCYSDVVKRTLKMAEDGTVHVITGDIPAMWLRDSACQMLAYFAPARECSELADILTAISRRQVRLLNYDPYANAFNLEADGRCYSHDDTKMGPLVWERKYELDSLCYPIWFAHRIWKETGRTNHFDGEFLTAAKNIISVIRIEQHHEEKSEYFFRRSNCRYFDTLSRNGRGNLVNSGIGLVWSGFRPSDDACTFGYNIPSNMMCAVVMGQLAEIIRDFYREEKDILREAELIREEIITGIEKYGVADLGDCRVYAYETDGFGQFLIMDDANMPSLLAMKFMGYEPDDKSIYEATRKLILSRRNPYYYEGEFLRGIGSPHTDAGYVWPIALAVQGLTDRDMDVKRQMIEMIAAAHAGTGSIHESVDADDPCRYSREWFSWANVMYCLLVMDYCKI